MQYPITLTDLLDLAKLGLSKIQEDSDLWIGAVPTSDQVIELVGRIDQRLRQDARSVVVEDWVYDAINCAKIVQND